MLRERDVAKFRASIEKKISIEMLRQRVGETYYVESVN